MRTYVSMIRRFTGKAVSAILPERCPVCGGQVQGGGLGQPVSLCVQCLSQIEHVYAPVCDVCGWPRPNADVPCVHCVPSRYISRHRFPLVYGDATTDMILRLKHGDRPELARRLAQWMVTSGAELLHDADLLIPVPIHWTRLVRRQYNQSAELARHVAAACGVPLDVRVLRRTRMTPAQGHRNPSQRRANVAKAFAVRSVASVEGKRIVLIDDVFTTGATVEACAKTLCQAGARQVDVLTAASVRNI